MPSLTPQSESSETLTPVSEGTETLAALAEEAQTITALTVLERAYEFLYPSQGHPSESINSLGNIYPGLYGTVVGHALSLLTEATEALTVLTED